MKKSRLVVVILAAVVLLLAAALFLLVQNLDALVAAAIEKYGSRAAGTSVRVEGVEIELSAGTGTIQGLTVANPEGFAPEPIFALDEISLSSDPRKLTADLTVIESIAIGSPSFFYQIDQSGKTNLSVIKENLEGYAGRRQKEEKAERGESMRLVVKQLTMAGGKGTVDLTALGGQRYEASMPPITLRNIGGEGGITPAALGEAVLKEMIRQLEKSAAREAAERALRQKAGEKAGELEKKIEEKTGETLKDILGR